VEEEGARGGDDSARDDEKNRELVELWQKVLREELRHRRDLREMFEQHEKILGRKVRQLRLERGWTQEQLAERLNEVGWPMHQTTVAKLEAGARPIRIAEADALAIAFGLPIEAMWYMPIADEPWSLAKMKDRLKGIDDFITTLEEHLRSTLITYAGEQSERMRLVQAMNEAAKAADRGDLEDLHLSPEESLAFVHGMDDRRRDREQMLEAMDPEERAAYKERYAVLDQLENDAPRKFAAEAWRMHQAGQGLQEIARFLAEAMPPGTLDPMRAALEIAQDALRPPRKAQQAHDEPADERAER
jgi:transcriptional regulator with XRE-family HTH domain